MDMHVKKQWIEALQTGKMPQESTALQALLAHLQQQEVTEYQLEHTELVLCHVPSVGCAYFILGDNLCYVPYLASGQLERNSAGELKWDFVLELPKEYQPRLQKVVELLKNDPTTILADVGFY
jgi:hypothetical protein